VAGFPLPASARIGSAYQKRDRRYGGIKPLSAPSRSAAK